MSRSTSPVWESGARRSGAPEPDAAPPRRGPGRPRTAGHDERILQAAIELLDRGEEVTVGRVVELSGVSRAGLYRRWPSMTDLIAAALDLGREVPRIALDDDLVGALLRGYTESSDPGAADEGRFRLRIRLAMTDRKLGRAHWRSHVARRREGIARLLTEGIRRGDLRRDLDVDACIDLMNGVFYYQIVVRGASLTDPVAVARCRSALVVALRGMLVDPARADALAQPEEPSPFR